jgi:hypothetical protein
VLWSQGLHNLTITSTTLSYSAVASMTQQHCRWHDLTSTSRHGQVAPTVSSPAWLDSIVANMTRHLHRAAAKSPQQCHHQHDSATLSPSWLDIYIMSWPSRPGSAIANMIPQHCHQHDSTSTSHRDKVAPAVPLLAWLGSTIASMTRHLHRTTAKSPRQHHRSMTQ